MTAITIVVPFDFLHPDLGFSFLLFSSVVDRPYLSADTIVDICTSYLWWEDDDCVVQTTEIDRQ